MSTYRIVTVAKTVYVHNVVRADVEEVSCDPDPAHELILTRDGGARVRFPLSNVLSYEMIA